MSNSICNVCDVKLSFDLKSSLTNEEILGFRETMVCDKCGSISRDRALMWAFSNCVEQKNCLSDLEKNKNLHIFESYGLRAYPKKLKSKYHYINTKTSHFSPKLRLFPKKYADLQNLFFDDNTFDFFLVSDVFEHVRKDEKAFSEIYRVLKRNGYLIFTTPFDYSQEKTKLKVQVKGDTNVLLSEPVYHNSGAENPESLEYRTYGKDLFRKLNSVGFNLRYLQIQIPSFSISQQEIFICRKNKPPNTSFLDKNNVIVFRNEEHLSRFYEEE